MKNEKIDIKSIEISNKALNAFKEFFKYWDFDDFYRHCVFLRWPEGNNQIKLRKRNDKFTAKGVEIWFEDNEYKAIINID